ncbi:carboxypeptidase-like regulatory domain-containing protein [Arthrobacter sp. AK01]|uniref:MSCRAMM family protein n=1 Tax=Arthrobacter sp. AK01 TaxID=2894084 RepID=UPI001E36C951|nr:carboxypeptidase-like regulatory domain-containing protein [Arthrobacter sp. AK01]MCD4853749.1 carboxypeptidase-like regulatory domain-containing protein [Arthrobacter sp. AK01]
MKSAIRSSLKCLILLSILLSLVTGTVPSAEALESSQGTISGKLIDTSVEDFTELTIQAYPVNGRGGAGSAKPRYDGSFTLLNLMSGEYQIHIVSYTGQILAQWYGGDGHQSSAERIILAPKQNLILSDFSLVKGAEVRGKVGLPAGIDATKAHVSITGDDSGPGPWYLHEEYLKSDGSYSVKDIYPGKYWIRFESGSSGALGEPYPFSESWRSSLVVLEDGQELEVNVDLELPSSISGKLIAAPGVSVSGFYAQVHRLGEAGVTSSGEVNDDGSYSIGGLRAGDYEVHFTDYDRTNFFVDRWYGGAGNRENTQYVSVGTNQNKRLDNTTITLGGSVRGTILSSEVRGYANVEVSLLTTDGKVVVAEVADESGSYVVPGVPPGGLQDFIQ